MKFDNQIAKAIWYVFRSPSESDSMGEVANMVDGLYAIARALEDVAEAIEDLGSKIK